MLRENANRRVNDNSLSSIIVNFTAKNLLKLCVNTQEFPLPKLDLSQLNNQEDIQSSDDDLEITSDYAPIPPNNPPGDLNHLIKILLQALPSIDEIKMFIKWQPGPGGGKGGSPDQIKAIIALILSGLVFCGGVYILQYDYTVGSMIMSAGRSGMMTSFNQFYSGEFNLKDILMKACKDGGTTLLVCGFGYFSGSIAAISLQQSGFTESQIMRASQIIGSLVGSGVSVGTYIISCEINGEEVFTFELVLSGIAGALDGMNASVVGAKAELIFSDKRPMDGKSIEMNYARRLYNYFYSCESIEPTEIRFTQDFVTNPVNIDKIIESMKINKWQGEPIDVIRMQDGNLSTFDNRRVYAAKKAGIKVWAHVHHYLDTLPSGFAERRGVIGAKTWGDAILKRAQGQRSYFLTKLFPYGWFTNPYIMTGKNKIDKLFNENVKEFGMATFYLQHILPNILNNKK